MPSKTEKATSWTENVSYIECPECEFVECLGTDSMWRLFSAECEDAEWKCDNCGKEFLVEDLTE